MTTKRIGSVVLAAVALFGVPASALCLTYNGSSTIGEEYLPKAALAYYQETGIRFGNIGIDGSEKGLADLLAGKVDLAGVSRPLTAEEMAKGLVVKTIGFDAVGVFVNKANPVKNLSKEQLKGIFTGKITRWSAVGGPDAAIEVVTEILKGNRATLKVFRDLVLPGAEYRPTREIDSPHACVRYVAQNPNAITHASIRFAEAGNALLSVDGISPSPENIASGKYPITRPLHIMHRAAAPDDVKKFVDFLSSAKGEEILKRYFTPAR